MGIESPTVQTAFKKYVNAENNLGKWEEAHRGPSRDESKHNSLKAEVIDFKNRYHDIAKTEEHKQNEDKLGKTQCTTNPSNSNLGKKLDQLG